jgi:hypothetical protein
MRANDIAGVTLAFTDRPASIETAQTGALPDAGAIVAAIRGRRSLDERRRGGAASGHASNDGSFALTNVPAGESA